MVKNPPAMWETQFQSLSGEDPLKKGMAIHSSSLDWKIPQTEEPHGLQSMGLQRVWHNIHFHSYLGELLFGICNEDFINLCFLYSILYISISALFSVLQKSGNAFVTLKNLVKWNGRKGERWRRNETERGQVLSICRTCRLTLCTLSAQPS